ncbi:putative multi-domain containing protein [Aduncisulcus paluster]|uniref:Multi-domain containing protein n=1 Tax=Aduncisulcus paluster TaxID=2918883 RepID=A0ABQ5K776_9EUKA|nr:putative multi-domain containing protein [Aduncisulcus paluster]
MDKKELETFDRELFSRGCGTWGSREIPQYRREIANAMLCRHLGADYLSVRPGPGGRKMAYLEGWRVISLANQTFGYDGWSSEISSIKCDYLETQGGRFSCQYTAIVRVSLPNGCYHDGIGSGCSENMPKKSDAIDKAQKGAITDGLKRAMKLFGDGFGNSSSSKDIQARALEGKRSTSYRSIDLEHWKSVKRRAGIPDWMGIMGDQPLSSGIPGKEEDDRGRVGRDTIVKEEASMTSQVGRPGQQGQMGGMGARISAIPPGRSMSAVPQGQPGQSEIPPGRPASHDGHSKIGGPSRPMEPMMQQQIQSGVYGQREQGQGIQAQHGSGHPAQYPTIPAQQRPGYRYK